MITGRTISCTSCGGTIAIRAAGYTVSLACQYCGALLDVATPDVRLISDYVEAVAKLELPLGSRGAMFGVEWEAIGWQERQADGDVWEEYLLFNPYAGYRWLVHAGDLWQFGVLLTDQPQAAAGDRVERQGKDFRLDGMPTYITTTRVLGEFYWKVRAGEQVGAASYVHGTETLSLEHNAEEINWTKLITLTFTPNQFHNPFQAPPAQGGDGGAHPAPITTASRSNILDSWANLPGMLDGDLSKMFIIAAIAMAVIWVATSFYGGITQTIQNKLTVDIDGAARDSTLGSIVINRADQAVRIWAYTDQAFGNKWVDLDYALVDKHNQRTIYASGALEYYAGVDTDGSSWTEGSHQLSVDISSVPRGAYDVIVEAQAHHWDDPKSASTYSAPPAAPNPWATGSTNARNAATNPWAATSADSPPVTPTDAQEIGLEADVGVAEWGVFYTVLALLFTPPGLILYWRHRQG